MFVFHIYTYISLSFLSRSVSLFRFRVVHFGIGLCFQTLKRKQCTYTLVSRLFEYLTYYTKTKQNTKNVNFLQAKQQNDYIYLFKRCKKYIYTHTHMKAIYASKDLTWIATSSISNISFGI